MNELLQDAMKMLRRGQKAIERQEWEKGETAQEWYFAAGQLAHQIQMECELNLLNQSATSKSKPPLFTAHDVDMEQKRLDQHSKWRKTQKKGEVKP